jgi:hypothetical protein
MNLLFSLGLIYTIIERDTPDFCNTIGGIDGLG